MSELLLIAPNCDGNDVGESWVAFQWSKRLAERHDVTLLTCYRAGRQRPSEQLPGARVIEWPERPSLRGRAERLNSMLKPGYPSFYRHCRRWVREALSRGERFDVAHQVVPVAMRYPTPIRGFGIPYVIGPVGGSLLSPPGFEGEDTAPWYVSLRGLDRWRLKHDWLLRRTYEDATTVLGIAQYVRETLGDLSIQSFQVMSETGVDDLGHELQRSEHPGTIRLLYVGRLIRTKGARDAILAMPALADHDVHLDIVGDGFDRASCERLAQALGVSDRITFHGALPRTAVDAYYQRSDIFVFPSYREPGGNVVFEAMAASLPLVVSDRGGPAAAVDDRCAIVVTPTDPQEFAADIASAIAALVDNPQRRLDMGRHARERVAQIALWEKKIDAIETVYAEAAERFARG